MIDTIRKPKKSIARLFRRIMSFALFALAINAANMLATRLGVWSTPTKSGLLPYEAPSFAEFKEIFVRDAFAAS